MHAKRVSAIIDYRSLWNCTLSCGQRRLFAHEMLPFDAPAYYSRKTSSRSHAYHYSGASDVDLDDVIAGPFGSQPSVHTTDKSHYDGDADSLHRYR